MFKEQMNKIKSLVLKKVDDYKGKEIPNKRKVENLVVFLIILIITIIAINSIIKNDKPKTKDEQSPYKILADSDTKNKRR